MHRNLSPKTKRCWLGAALLFSLGVASTRVHAAYYDPALRWRTIPTPHFNIHYAEGLELEATKLSGLAEEVHRALVAVVGWTPRQPTEVTLVDRTDLANGNTTPLPYNQIVIYPVRPPLWESIGDYDDWLRSVFIHEYSHVLGLDPVRGYAAVTRSIFGRVYVPSTPTAALFWFFAAPPNLFLPPWVHEGMAVNFESDFTGRGRKESTYFRMVYRVDVASGTIPPLDRLAGDFPGWPSGHEPYIYGTRLLELVEEERGKEAIGRLILGHSGRFPYATSAPARRNAGGTYAELYGRMKDRLEAEYAPQIRKLEAEGLTRYRALTRSGYAATGPLWLDHRTVAFTRFDGVLPARLVRLDLTSGEEDTLADRPGLSSRPTRLADGTLAYSRLEVSRPLAGGLLLADLYRCAAEGGKVHRLTRGSRLIEADFSAAAGAYVSVENEASSQRLVLLRPDGSRLRVLLAEPGFRYDGPRWSPDGRSIAFSRKAEKGLARLAVLEPASGALRLLTPEGAQAGFPAWSPDGRQLAFSWDRTGVWDLYAWELSTGACRRLTRVLGGAFEPDWSPDGKRLAFTSYSARGFDIALLELSDALSDPALPAAPAETVSAPQTAVRPRDASVPESRPYSAWPRVLPTFWLPDLWADNQGAAPGLWTAGQDPLRRHTYYAAGYWAPASARFYGQGIYVNNVSYPTVTVRGWKLPAFHSELLGYDYWEEDRGAGIEARFQLPRVRRFWSLGVGWAWEEVSRLSRVDEDLNGRRDLADLPFQGRTNPATVSLLYDSTFPYSNLFTVGPEGGTRLEGLYRLRTEALGAELDRQELILDGRKYVNLGLPRLVAAARGKVGLSRGDRTLQSAFQVGGEAGEFPVRGYPARVERGERAAVVSGELRFPFWSPYRGIRDWPAFLAKLRGAAFFDAGRAWGDGGDGEWRRGAGGELRLDTVLGYYFPTTLVVGYGHGFDEGGEDRVYVTFGGAY